MEGGEGFDSGGVRFGDSLAGANYSILSPEGSYLCLQTDGQG